MLLTKNRYQCLLNGVPATDRHPNQVCLSQSNRRGRTRQNIRKTNVGQTVLIYWNQNGIQQLMGAHERKVSLPSECATEAVPLTTRKCTISEGLRLQNTESVVKRKPTPHTPPPLLISLHTR